MPAHVFKSTEHPPAEAYVKEIDGVEIEIEIEFLTDDTIRGDKDKNVAIAGIVAQPLSYLKLSLQKTRSFTTRSGEKGAQERREQLERCDFLRRGAFA